MSFLGSALGAVTGGVFNLLSGSMNNSAQRSANEQANDWNVENYKNRYQFAAEDMKAAGLNPILAATQGIGGSITGASALAANSYDIAGGLNAGASAANQSASAKSTTELLESTKQKNLADASAANSASVSNSANAYATYQNAFQQKQSFPYVLEQAKQNAANSAKQIDLTNAQIYNQMMQGQAAVSNASSQALLANANANFANEQARGLKMDNDFWHGTTGSGAAGKVAGSAAQGLLPILRGVGNTIRRRYFGG